jgi:hypothetical protein
LNVERFTNERRRIGMGVLPPWLMHFSLSANCVNGFVSLPLLS